MSDNILVGGKTIATDEVTIGGVAVHVQRAKLGFGSDGTYTADVNPSNPLPVADDVRTSGGATATHLVVLGSANPTLVKGSAGTVYGVSITNRDTAPYYVKLYNSATAPTAGSGTPYMVLSCVGLAAGGAQHYNFPKGVAFGTGIGFTVIKDGPLDSDTDVAVADKATVSIQYK